MSATNPPQMTKGARKGIIFYDNWCAMLNSYWDSGDTEAAKELAFGIIRLYSTGEIIDFCRPDLALMLQHTIAPGIEIQIKNRERGTRATPYRFTDEQNFKIRQMRAEGMTAIQIGAEFGCPADAIRRSVGWKGLIGDVPDQLP